MVTRRWKNISSFISVGAVVGSFLCSCAIFVKPDISASELTWIDIRGVFNVPLAFILDDLSRLMLLVVSGVGSLIHIYSLGYMRDDEGKSRYFAALSLFMFAMLGIVLANNFVMMFIFWELVGFTSYVLIGHWFERDPAAEAAKKAFLTTRIGDFGFMIGILMVWMATGSVVFDDIVAHLSKITSNPGYLTIAALLIFCGAVGKSAQFPLHVWLPDAMEGPTPVSALIHAATMVAAGVYLLVRVAFLIQASQTALLVIAWIGTITALLGALMATQQSDIKRILAYSTVSQLGLMMVSLGVGGVAAGIMHLLAHGFFKALLFLGAGSVIHGLHHEQDIRKMGGLRRSMPITFSTYAIGMMALSGVPFFFSGGWTKEEILHATSNWPRSHLPHYLMLIGVILTALYMTRQIIYVFFGNRRAASENAHESPGVMTVPLIVLAVCAILFSVVLTPAWPWLESYLTGHPAHFDAHLLIQPMIVVSLALVGAGVSVGIWIYRRAGETDPLQHAQPALFRFLENKMWIDEIYERTVIALSAILARLSDWMDRHVWDGLVRGVGALGQFFGRVTTGADERVINAGVDESTIGAHGFGRVMSRWHTGQIQTYLGAVALGMLALILLYAWLG